MQIGAYLSLVHWNDDVGGEGVVQVVIYASGYLWLSTCFVIYSYICYLPVSATSAESHIVTVLLRAFAVDANLKSDSDGKEKYNMYKQKKLRIGKLQRSWTGSNM